MEVLHKSVMKDQVLEYLVPSHSDAMLVDCTLGEGGHSEAFLQKYPHLKVIGIDRDAEIQKRAIERLECFKDRFEPVNAWFDEYLATLASESVDLILFDLGISFYHYAASGRGFSFNQEERLDMRLDENQSLDAYLIVNTYPEEALANVIYEYGEERYSRRIARAIVSSREEKPIESAKALEEIISASVPKEYRYGRINPATRTFQALRIEVNKELDRITPALSEAVRVLTAGGLIAVITFHSLEDRRVKWFFKDREKGEKDIKIITKHPLVPSEEELRLNPPSRSAKLRIVEKEKKDE